MGIPFQCFNRRKSGPNRIQRDVVHHAQHRRTVFDKQCLVSPLEDMAAIANKPIKTVRKGALQPLHTDDEVGVLCLKASVVMI